MSIKIKHNAVPQIDNTPVVCYKVVRKTFAYKHLVEDADLNRFHAIYETIMQSYDVTDHITNKTTWTIPVHVFDEIETKRKFGIFPICKIIKEGYIFTYDEAGIKEYVKTLKHNMSIYGNEHFCHDLRIFRCIIPSGSAYYTGTNNGLTSYASKELIFKSDVTDQLLGVN